MLREVHEHVTAELEQSSKTDTVFVITAVLFNLIVLGINWGVASDTTDGVRPPANDGILALLIVGTALINTFSIRALLTGRDTRRKLQTGLVQMYRDNGVDQYYDPSLLGMYGTRYRLFAAVLVSLAAIAITIPLVARIWT